MGSLESAFPSLQKNGHVPLIDVLVAKLQLCREQTCLAHARSIHTQICSDGLDTRISVGNHLVPLFLDCGSLLQAQQSFSRLVSPSPSSFTSLMHGYIDHGECQLALGLFGKMQGHRAYATEYAFVAALKACSRLHSLERGQEVHREIVSEEYEGNPFICTTLVDMYAHCSSPADAWDVLAASPMQDVSAWNALISGCVECDRCEEALVCSERMRLQGVIPNAVTFKCTLKACSTLGAIGKGRLFHAHVVGAGLDADSSISNTLVDMYARCCSMPRAREVFDTSPARDAVSWNALIAGYVENGFPEEALVALEQMQDEGLSPNAITYVCGLRACTRLRAVRKGQDIHAKLVKQTLAESQYVANSLVDLYAQGGLFLEARKVSETLLARDVFTWTSLIAGYAAHGRSAEALDCMKGMQLDGVSPNVVSWSAVISGFANEEGDSEEALLLYRQMQEQGLMPNSVTLASILKACGESAALNRGRKLHAQANLTVRGRDHHLYDYEPLVAAALIDMYGKCGCMGDAQQVFDAIPKKIGLAEWNALIAGYARHGASEAAFTLIEEKTKGGGGLPVPPDEVSFVSILSVCSHVGRAAEALDHLKYMVEFCRVAATIKHHSCLIDLLSRTGRVDEAWEALKALPMRPDAVMWSSIMAAALRSGGNADVARQALQHLASCKQQEYAAALISALSTFVGAELGDENRLVNLLK